MDSNGYITLHSFKKLSCSFFCKYPLLRNFPRMAWAVHVPNVNMIHNKRKLEREKKKVKAPHMPRKSKI